MGEIETELFSIEAARSSRLFEPTPFCILQIEFHLCSISPRNLYAWQHLSSYRDPHRIRRNDLFQLTNHEKTLDLANDFNSTVRSRLGFI